MIHMQEDHAWFSGFYYESSYIKNIIYKVLGN